MTESIRRVKSVDLLRGIIMIFMALDHTRDYFSKLRFPPEDLSRSTPFLFFTRWITHFCAPAFFLLAGVSASLLLARGRSKKELSRFLFTRGLWLVFLELTILQFVWNFSFEPPWYLLVIWALGLSMIVLSALVFLSERIIAAIALVTIVGHNLLDGIAPATFGSLAPVWNVLHVPGFPIPEFLVGYPLIPWFAVMALGFALGGVYRWEPEARKRFLIQAGVAAVIAFILLRGFNLYGNPSPWTGQRTVALTVASFLNTLKYPPSLHYLLMTLGPALIALAMFENARGRLTDAISVYGKVPFFYYVVHIAVIHSLAYALALYQGSEGGFLGLDISRYPEWYGVNLFGVYVAWAIVVAILYFPCRWMARLKAERKSRWLSYI